MDPLRPFADFVRSLWSARAEKVEGARPVAATDSRKNEAPASTALPKIKSLAALENRLRGRLKAIGADDRGRRQKIFVETVMLWELGDEIAQDQRFPELVATVAEQISAREDISQRLGEILDGIATS